MSFLKKIWPQCCQRLGARSCQDVPTGSSIAVPVVVPDPSHSRLLPCAGCRSPWVSAPRKHFSYQRHLCIGIGCTSPAYHESKHGDHRAFQSSLKPWKRGVEQEPPCHDSSYPRKLHLGWLTPIFPPLTECSIFLCGQWESRESYLNLYFPIFSY